MIGLLKSSTQPSVVSSILANAQRPTVVVPTGAIDAALLESSSSIKKFAAPTLITIPCSPAEVQKADSVTPTASYKPQKIKTDTRNRSIWSVVTADA